MPGKIKIVFFKKRSSSRKPDITAHGQTHVGRRRQGNEDSFLVDKTKGILLVADGMGGHQNGEIASKMAIESISAALSQDSENDRDQMKALLVKTLHETNAAIYEKNCEGEALGLQKMGTTIVGLWHPPEQSAPFLFHVGDSRIYRFRDGKLTLLTKDDSLYQQWIDMGQEGTPPNANIILQALGPADEIEPTVRILEDSEAGDYILLCSDGLNGMLKDSEIEAHLADIQPNKLDEMCQNLIDAANDAGGKDNVTVILAAVS